MPETTPRKLHFKAGHEPFQPKHGRKHRPHPDHTRRGFFCRMHPARTISGRLTRPRGQRPARAFNGLCLRPSQGSL